MDDLLRSAGHSPMAPTDRLGLADAVGVWIEELRLVLVDAGHPALSDLDDQSFEMMLARIAWHEWGHALSVVRAEADDVADGERLLALAPRGVSERIRRAGTVEASSRMSSWPTSTHCSCLVAAGARRESLRGSMTTSTSS